MMFKTNFILQEMVNIISNEGRLQELEQICDFCHLRFSSFDDCFEQAFNFGEYVGKFLYGEEIWKLSIPDGGCIYFFGDLKVVKNKIQKVV
jgi:hypothetical protein